MVRGTRGREASGGGWPKRQRMQCGMGRRTKVAVRESRSSTATDVDTTGTEEGERGPFRSFVAWFEGTQVEGSGSHDPA